MIPSNIVREHLLKALGEVAEKGVAPGRQATRYHVVHDGRHYPPKYIISLAHRYANGTLLAPGTFSGGQESNAFLESRGFRIVSLDPDEPKGPSAPHSERCSECKNVIIEMLRRIHGSVKIDHKIDVPARLEDYAGRPFYGDLKRIFEALQDHRGHRDFVRLRSLHRCDLFVPTGGFVVELDESQHFTEARAVALAHYPRNLRIGFDIDRWRSLCRDIDAHDNDPAHRDEQRAWYDTLRDFLPLIQGLEPTARLHMGNYQWCSLNPDRQGDVRKFKALLPARRSSPGQARAGSHLTVATVTLRSDGRASNQRRTALLGRVLGCLGSEADLVVLPGGFYQTSRPARTLYDYAARHVGKFVKGTTVVCLGIDGRGTVDQLALALNRNGILAVGRKFYPTKDERSETQVAGSYLGTEDGYERVLRVKGRTAYLAACYDGFGISHQGLANPGVDLVLDLVHGFNPKGMGYSGDVYFARHGFAGASRQWTCPVFGAAVFFNRPIPKAWPTGVLWNRGEESTKRWRYEHNLMQPADVFRETVGDETGLIRVFDT